MFVKLCLYVFQFRNDTLFEKHIQTLLYKQCLSKFAQCLEVLANKTKLSLTPSATKHVSNGYGINADKVSVKFLQRNPNMPVLPTACSSCNSKLLTIVIKLDAAVRKKNYDSLQIIINDNDANDMLKFSLNLMSQMYSKFTVPVRCIDLCSGCMLAARCTDLIYRVCFLRRSDH